MVFCVINDPSKLDPVLDAWLEAGIRGATIFESNGIRRQRKQYVPMRFHFASADRMEGNVTLMAIVPDPESIQSCLTAAENVIGDLNLPETGVFAAWPLIVSKGVALPPYAEEGD